MSKYVEELLIEFNLQEAITDDFSLYILTVKVDEAGEVESFGSAQPVTHIEIDHDSKACLLHFAEDAPFAAGVGDARSVLAQCEPGYEVCAAQVQELDDKTIRTDSPLVGFGENIDEQCFFAVCEG